MQLTCCLTGWVELSWRASDNNLTVFLVSRISSALQQVGLSGRQPIATANTPKQACLTDWPSVRLDRARFFLPHCCWAGPLLMLIAKQTHRKRTAAWKLSLSLPNGRCNSASLSRFNFSFGARFTVARGALEWSPTKDAWMGLSQS